MPTGNNWFIMRLDEDTERRLKHLSDSAGQSMSAVVRGLIHGTAVKEMPPIEYHAMNRELYRIGGNLNQIAKVANATGQLDREMFNRAVLDLRRAILEIQTAVDLR